MKDHTGSPGYLLFSVLVILFTIHGVPAADNPLPEDTTTRISITTAAMTPLPDTVVLGTGLSSITLYALGSDEYGNHRGFVVVRWSGTPLGNMSDSSTFLYLTAGIGNQESGWIYAECGDPLVAIDSIYVQCTSESSVIAPAAVHRQSVNHTQRTEQYSLSGRKLPSVTGRGIAVSPKSNRTTVIVK